jgi:hypothetical protein
MDFTIGIYGLCYRYLWTLLSVLKKFMHISHCNI